MSSVDATIRALRDYGIDSEFTSYRLPPLLLVAVFALRRLRLHCSSRIAFLSILVCASILESRVADYLKFRESRKEGARLCRERGRIRRVAELGASIRVGDHQRPA
jgi:hypothetical protein